MKVASEANDRVETSTRNTKLGLLELGRGLAALSVVLHHASLSSDAFTSSSHAAGFAWGAMGVDFFFVLSGFIIYHVHGNDSKSFDAAIGFLIKRLRRVYIPYLPVTLVLMVAYLTLPDFSQGNREWGWFTSLTLLPSDEPPALSVAWTLVYEMMFYLFFICFYATRFFWGIVAAWVLLILGSAVAWGGTPAVSNPVLFHVLNPIILEFIAGMMAAYSFGILKPKRWLAPVLLGCFMIVSYMAIDGANRSLFGIALAPIVLGLAMAEVSFSFRVPAGLLLFGASSYAIYLIHNPLQSVVARVLYQFDNWVLTFAACVIAGVAAGVLYHILYERPVLRRLTAIRPQENFRLTNNHESASRDP